MTPHDYRSLDQAHVWHPFTPMQEYVREATPVIASAEGFELVDTDGRRYLDGTSSLWCNVHGHRVPEIDAAIRSQLDRVAHSTLLGLGNVPSVELARELIRIAPRGLTRVFFSDDGSTAVEAALKMVYQFHQQRRDRPGQRDLFVRLSHAYHGDTIGSVSVGGISLFHGTYGGLLFRTVEVPAPVAYRVPAGFTAASYLAHCFDEVERVVRENRDRVAGFVIEPLVQGAAGMLVHPRGYLRHVREVTAANDIPLIADEVATGFGRTGTMFACEQEGVAPDVLCLSKGISGGYLPLAATLTTDRVFDAFLGEREEARTFFHGHTYTGNPLACAAALASLNLFEQNRVLDNVHRNAELLRNRLAEWVAWPHVGEVRQQGIMVGIELVRDKSTQTSFPTSARIGHRVTLAARTRGVITRPLGDVIVLMPAPGMPPNFVHRLCDIIGESIQEVMSGGDRPRTA
jgi:adenosylmethionine-8-amino-7-oxononanoate aminotransferase